MAEITAALVKDLREKSGVGMMDCKRALMENNGDIAASIDWLRAKGLSKAAKKADRAAAEGLVAGRLSDDGKTGALIELNAETDFVAKNDIFQGVARDSRPWRWASTASMRSRPPRLPRRRSRRRGHPPDRDHRREHAPAPFGPPVGEPGRRGPLPAQRAG
jgi:hypothetical protein